MHVTQCKGRDTEAHNNSALNAQVLLLVQPYLYFLPALQVPEDQVDLHGQAPLSGGCSVVLACLKPIGIKDLRAAS